jgi:hypothetical protein
MVNREGGMEEGQAKKRVGYLKVDVCHGFLLIY